MSDNKDSNSKHELIKLDDDGDINNYDAFVTKAKLKLKELKLWKYVEGKESIPPMIPSLRKTVKVKGVDRDGQEREVEVAGNEVEVEEAKKKSEPWAEGDLRAMRLIVEAVPSHKISIVSHVESAKEAWETLRKEYQPVNSSRAKWFYTLIHNYACEPGDDVEKWVTTIRKMYHDLCTQDKDMLDDANFASTLVNLLPSDDSWRVFTRELRTEMEKREKRKTDREERKKAQGASADEEEEDPEAEPLKSSEIIERIRSENWSINANRTETKMGYLQASTASTVPRKRLHTQVNTASASFSSHPAPKRARVQCTNSYCARPIGHLQADCFAYGGGRVGKYPEWWTGPKDIHLSPLERAKGARGMDSVRRQQRGHAALHTNVADNAEASVVLAQEHDFYSLNTVADETSTNVICHSEAISSDVGVYANTACFHDSGANRHIFFDRAVFRNYKAILPIIVKGFGSSLTTSAVGVGDIVFRASCKGVSSLVKLSDVLHVPNAQLNLVSQGCLERKGIYSQSGGGTMTLSLDGKDLVEGRLLANNLYKLDLEPIPGELKDRISEDGAQVLNVSTNGTVSSTTAGFYTTY